MSRRLPFRRRGRRPAARRRLPARLRQAHRLLEKGKHLQAAAAFQDLAWRAQDLKLPRASFLFLQAGRALILGNQLEAGQEQIKHAFSMMHSQTNAARFGAVSKRVVQELKQLGHMELADTLEAELESSLPSSRSKLSASGDSGFLPGKCEQCGATLHPDEIELLSDGSQACAYCGSRILQGDST